MPTKKKTTTKTVQAKAVAAPTTPRPAPPPEPVENASGHRHIYERVNGIGQGETIYVCPVCADIKR